MARDAFIRLSASFERLNAAIRGAASAFEMLEHALNHPVYRRDAACERFMIAAMAPHWKRAPKCFWKPPKA